MEHAAASQDPVVICLQQDVDVEWYPVFTDGQQLDHEVVALVQENASSQPVESVNCMEVVPDFLAPVISNCVVGADNTLQTNTVNYQADEDGQVFYITYTVPGTAENEWQDETPSVVQDEAGKVKQSILHVTEDGSTVYLNVGNVVNEGATDGDIGVEAISIDFSTADKQEAAQEIPSGKLKNSFVGSNLCIEEKLQIVDAMLPPAPKRTTKKKDKDETESEANEVILSYVCLHCTASFSEKQEYFRHLNVHKEEQKIQSGITADQSDSASAETAMQPESDTHIVLRRYVCPQCPAAFSRLSQLSSHQQHAHLGDRPHKCQICKKSFYKRCDLRSHLNIHLGISKSICEVCGRKFNHVSNLIRHTRIHTGIKPYPCSVCGRRFSQLNGMHQHKTIHQDNRDISCCLCPKTFKSFNIMRRHMRCAHNDKLSSMGKEATAALNMVNPQIRRFYCKLCGESFKFAALLRHHESLHLKENKFHCKFCKNDFLTAEDMKTHFCGSYSPNKDAELQSNNVGEQTNGEVLIYITQEDSTGLKQIQIKEACISNEVSNLVNVAVPGEETQVACNSDLVANVVLVCKGEGEAFEQNQNCEGNLNETPLDLKELKQKQQQEELQELQIEKDQTPELLKIMGLQRTCTEKLVETMEAPVLEEKTFPNEQHGDKSSKPTEATNDPFIPAEPALPSDIKNKIRIKLKTKNTKKSQKQKNKKKKITPENSPQESAENTSIIDSMNINELTEIFEEVNENGEKVKIKVYSCPECPKHFNKSSNFKQHLGVHYMDLMKHSCPNCGLCFAWKSTLNKHIIKMHSEVPPPKASCEFCGREYPFAVQVQEHIKRDHLKQRPHVCSTCNKTFYKKHDLNVHLRTHTRERPYICGTCSKSFSHLSHIIRHERIHNGVRPYKCTDCDREFIQSTSLKIHRQLHIKAAKNREVLGSCTKLENGNNI